MSVSKGRLCSAINCSNNRGRNSDLSFFRFPKEPERSKRWVINCRREDLVHKDVEYLSRNCCLCSKHFENSQFMNCNENSLIKTAVPTLFEINNPPKAVTLKRKARQHCDKMEYCKRTKLNKVEASNKICNGTGINTGHSTSVTSMQSQKCNTVESNGMREIKQLKRALRAKVNELSKLRRKYVELKQNFTVKIEVLTNQCKDIEQVVRIASRYMIDSTLQFFVT